MADPGDRDKAGSPSVEPAAPPRRKSPFARTIPRPGPKDAWERRPDQKKRSPKARVPRLVPSSADATIPLVDPDLAPRIPADSRAPTAPTPMLDSPAAEPLRPGRPPTPMVNPVRRPEAVAKDSEDDPNDRLGSDAEIEAELFRVLDDPDALMLDDGDDNTDEIIIVPSRWARWRRGWFDPPSAPPDGATGVRLARHLSYEVVVVAVTFLAATVLIFTSLNGEVRDLYVQSRNMMGMYPAQTSEQVVLVTVGKESLYLWNPSDTQPVVTPRAMLAEVVGVLDAAGARTIVLDFVFDAPSDGDEALAAAATAHGSVLSADRAELTDPTVGATFAAGVSPSLGDSIHSGVANLGEEELWIASEEHLARSAPLVMATSRARLEQPWPMSAGGEAAKAEATPHLTLLAAWTHARSGAGLDTNPVQLLSALQGGCTSVDGGQLRCDVELPELGLPPVAQPLHHMLPINFRGPEAHDGLPTLRASELLRVAATPALFRAAGVEQPLEIPEWLAKQVEGKLVVVGRVDEAADDRFATPFSFPLPTSADMAGCRIQAQTIDTLLSGRHVEHPPLWLMWVVAAACLALLVMSARMLREDVHTVAWLAAAGMLVVSGCAVFIVTDGLVINISVPLTAMLVGVVLARLRGWAID
ncbi:MAG: CHASE2 domain-containing sensor protein [Kiritimatiellia bacterium]|jgi:CHASE2 domain-containing sensor protein